MSDSGARIRVQATGVGAPSGSITVTIASPMPSCCSVSGEVIVRLREGGNSLLECLGVVRRMGAELVLHRVTRAGPVRRRVHPSGSG